MADFGDTPVSVIGSSLFDIRRDVDFSKEALTLPKFWNSFHNRLPQLVVVKEGFFGAHWFDEVASQEVYWIATSGSQTRVIARDPRERAWCVSIPLDYPLDVILVNSKGKAKGNPMRLRHLVSNNKLPVLVKLCEQSYIQLNVGSKRRLEELLVVTTYQERYLLGHTAAQNKLYKGNICALPLYLPIRVSPAVNPHSRNDVTWSRFLQQLRTSCESVDYSKYPVNQDIIVFSDEDLANNNETYDHISPENCAEFKHYQRVPQQKSGQHKKLKSETFPQSAKTKHIKERSKVSRITEFAGSESPERPRRLSDPAEHGTGVTSGVVEPNRMFWRSSTIGKHM